MLHETPSPKFFTVILNYDNEAFTRECLNSLNDIEYPNHHIIVIDDFSRSNEILNIVDEHKNVIFHRNSQNLNYCKSFNIGISLALDRGADFVFLVNNDTKDFSKNYIKEVIKTFRADRHVGIVGTNCVDYNGKILRDSSGSVRFGFDMVVPSEGYVLSRDALKNVGGFNEKLTIYMEDLDLLKRLNGAGYSFGFNSNASFAHYCGATSSTFKFKFTYLRTRNICLFGRYYLKGQSRRQVFREIISNSGASVKIALLDLKRGNIFDAIKRMLAVSTGLLVGYVTDAKTFFEVK